MRVVIIFGEERSFQETSGVLAMFSFLSWGLGSQVSMLLCLTAYIHYDCVLCASDFSVNEISGLCSQNKIWEIWYSRLQMGRFIFINRVPFPEFLFKCSI